MKLTPDLLAASYTFLRSVEPFKAWKMPPAHVVKFKIIRNPAIHADFGIEKGRPVIRVSANGAGTTVTLLSVMCHEMIHYRQHLTGKKDTHGASFQAMARRVCLAHGCFDPKTF